MTRGWGTLPYLLFWLVFLEPVLGLRYFGSWTSGDTDFFHKLRGNWEIHASWRLPIVRYNAQNWNMLIIYCHTRLDAIHYHTIHITNKICNKVIFFLHNHITYTGSIHSVRCVVSKNFITVRQSNFVSSNVPKPPGRHEPNLSRWWVIPWWTRPGPLEGWGSMVATEMGGSTTITTYWV